MDTAPAHAPRSAGLQRPPAPSNFSSYDGGWLQIAYHPTLAGQMRPLERAADAFRSELTALLGHDVLKEVHVRVGRTTGEMQTLAPPGAHYPKYASGVAFSELGLVLLSARARYPGERHDLLEVFRHELAHIALHDAVGRDRVPRWFNEGFAIHASREAQGARMQAMWTATLAGKLLPFSEITSSFPSDATTASVAYAQAADMVRFLLKSGQEHRLSALMRRLSRGQTFDEALSDAYGADMFLLEKQFRKDAARRYTFWPVLLGGSLVWVLALGLLVVGYFRSRQRSARKLARWAREEALQDARDQLARAVLLPSAQASLSHPARRATDATTNARPGPENSSASKSLTASELTDSVEAIGVQAPVPSVEHDGERWTLH